MREWPGVITTAERKKGRLKEDFKFVPARVQRRNTQKRRGEKQNRRGQVTLPSCLAYLLSVRKVSPSVCFTSSIALLSSPPPPSHPNLSLYASISLVLRTFVSRIPHVALSSILSHEIPRTTLLPGLFTKISRLLEDFHLLFLRQNTNTRALSRCTGSPYASSGKP